MPRLYRQYQQWAIPPIAAVAGAVVGISWFAPLSEPTPQKFKPGFAASCQQTFATDWQWTAPPIPVIYDWFSPLTEPVRIDPAAAPYEQCFTGAGHTDHAPTDWFAHFSEPVRAKLALTTACQPWDFTMDWQWTAPTVPSIYNWHAWLSEPVRSKPDFIATRQFLATDTASIPVSHWSWQQWLSEPVRLKQGLLASAQQAFTIDWKWSAPAPRIDSWHRALAEPVRTKESVPWQQPFTTDWNSPAVAISYWWAGLSEPVRFKRFPTALQQSYVADWRTPATTVGSWFKWLSEPVRSKQAVAYQQPFTVDWKWSAPVVTQYDWHAWLSEPVRFDPAAAPYEQCFTGAGTPSGADLSNFWFSWLSEPVRAPSRIASQQFFTIDWKWDAPAVDLRNYWFRPLSEPVRHKKAVAWQQPFTIDWKWTALTRYDWHAWLSEPVQFKQLPVALQQAYTADWRTPQVTVSSWFGWLTEPVREKPGLWAANHPFFTTDWKWDAPPIILIDYVLSVTESGDIGAFTFTTSDLIIGANVAVTEIWAEQDAVTVTEVQVGQMANVTITEIWVEHMANVTITEIEE